VGAEATDWYLVRVWSFFKRLYHDCVFQRRYQAAQKTGWSTTILLLWHVLWPPASSINVNFAHFNSLVTSLPSCSLLHAREITACAGNQSAYPNRTCSPQPTSSNLSLAKAVLHTAPPPHPSNSSTPSHHQIIASRQHTPPPPPNAHPAPSRTSRETRAPAQVMQVAGRCPGAWLSQDIRRIITLTGFLGLEGRRRRLMRGRRYAVQALTRCWLRWEIIPR
jgi:hypothetical protein